MTRTNFQPSNQTPQRRKRTSPPVQQKPTPIEQSDTKFKRLSVNDIKKLSGKEFEEFVSKVYQDNNYQAKVSPSGSKDGGIDIIVEKQGKKSFIQCKQWLNQRVGVPTVREVYGILLENKQFKNAIVITSGKFTDPAVEFCKNKRIELIDGKKLALMVQQQNGIYDNIDTPHIVVLQNGTKKERFWTVKSTFAKKTLKEGRPLIFPTQEALWEAAVEYFEWVEENPYIEERTAGISYGAVVKDTLPKLRPMTIRGLCLFIGISTVTWMEYKKQGHMFTGTCRQIEDVIYDQKFGGAAAGFFNHAITSFAGNTITVLSIGLSPLVTSCLSTNPRSRVIIAWLKNPAAAPPNF